MPVDTSVLPGIISTFKEFYRQKRSAIQYVENQLPNPGDYYARNCFDYYSCIFIHIPKTAGVAVSKSLFGHFMDHATLDWYLKNYHYSTVKKYFKFAFVRNPWDRLYSAYSFLKKGGMYPVDKAFYDQELSHLNCFEAFVMEWLSEEKLYSFVHFIPQHLFITPLTLHFDIRMDFLGRFENIKQDFSYVCTRLGMDERQLLKVNVTGNELNTYRQVYSKEMRYKINDLYAKDVDLFNYNFE